MDNENNEKLSIFDFGFSTTTEEELKRSERENIESLHTKLSESNAKLIGLKEIIWPLLEEFRKDPGNPIIKWPNRVAIINNLMKKINDYINA
jgi:hypothetical protein